MCGVEIGVSGGVIDKSEILMRVSRTVGSARRTSRARGQGRLRRWRMRTTRPDGGGRRRRGRLPVVECADVTESGCGEGVSDGVEWLDQMMRLGP